MKQKGVKKKMKNSQQNGLFQIYMNDRPISLSIVDKKRADLGYNMLRAMALNDIGIMIDGERSPIAADCLKCLDTNGKEVAVEPDLEWFGTSEDKLRIKYEILERDKAEEDMPDREAEQMDQYTLCYTSLDSGGPLCYAPKTWDMQKADEMQCFVLFGLHPSVSLTMRNDAGEDIIIKDADISDPEGNVYDYGSELEPEYYGNWPYTMSESSEREESDFHDDFAKAVEMLSMGELKDEKCCL